MKLAVAVLSLVAFLGGNQIQRSVDCYVCNSPSVLYLMAQYKMAVGDTAAGLRLLKQASVPSRVRETSKSESQVNSASKPCPDSSRT
jgi:hypothetical protein